jgi:hypothetical protein
MIGTQLQAEKRNKGLRILRCEAGNGFACQPNSGSFHVSSQYFGAQETEFLIFQVRKSTG